MTDNELSETLRIASKALGDNIALQLLLSIAADRIEQLSDVQTLGNYNERTY